MSALYKKTAGIDVSIGGQPIPPLPGPSANAMLARIMFSANVPGALLGYANTTRDNVHEVAKKDLSIPHLLVPGYTGYHVAQKLTAKHLLEQMRKEQLQQAGSQESPQAAAKVAALQHFGLYRVKTAFTLLANKTPKWRAENEAELLWDNTGREYDQSHRLEQAGRSLSTLGVIGGLASANARGIQGRSPVLPVVLSTLSGALAGGLEGRKSKAVAELAQQKFDGMGIQDPLERRMIEEHFRSQAGSPVSGAVMGGLAGLGIATGSAATGLLVGDSDPAIRETFLRYF